MGCVRFVKGQCVLHVLRVYVGKNTGRVIRHR